MGDGGDGASYGSAGSRVSDDATVRSETDAPSKPPYLPEMVITENLFQLPHRKLHSVRGGHSRQQEAIHMTCYVVCNLIATAALLVQMDLQSYPAIPIQGQDEVVGHPWWNP